VIGLEVAGVAVRSLREHTLRSFLNLLGIIIAVTTIVLVVSVISGLNRFAANLIGQLGPNTVIVSKFGIITSREQFLQAIRRRDFTVEDVEAVRRLVPRALRVTGRVAATHPVYADGRSLRNTFVIGTGPELPWMTGMELDDGRYFTDAEDRASRAVAVIGWDVKDGLFPHVDPIGRWMRVEGKPFRVIGMLTRQGKVFGQSQDQVVLIPLGAFQKAFGRHATVDLLVEAPDPASRAEVLDSVRSVIRARRGTPFTAPDPFGVIDAEALQSLWRNLTFFGFAIVIWISSVSLVVGGVAVANTMFASVVERTREIGIRMAMGARRRDIRFQFLVESATLASVGGLAGVLLGWGGAAAIAALSPFPAEVTLRLILAGLAVATLSGIAAGLLPAIRAARLDPVEAVREE
jgi:putative ABC transport system permease protein